MSQVDFTIVIPHRGPILGLWATIHSIEEELAKQGFNYNYVFVFNGEPKLDQEARNFVHFLNKSNKVKEVIVHPEPMAPPNARQLGSASADGKYIFFFDNHCIVARDYFRRAIADFEHFDIDILHSAFQFFLDDLTHYHYHLKLQYNFWGETGSQPPDTVRPFKIAASGHGGFAVKRSSWEELGGYGPTELWQGYGGEELYCDLKFWMMGKKVWLDPKVKHAHYAGKRSYGRHYTDDFYRNLLVSARVIGGEEWLYKVYESFADETKFIKEMTGKTMFDLMVEAEERSRDHAKEFVSKRTMDLETLIRHFQTESILY